MLVTVSDMIKYSDLPSFIQKTVSDWQSSQEYATIIRNEKYNAGMNPSLNAAKWKRVALDTGGVLNLKPQHKITSHLFKTIVEKREHRVLNNPIAFNNGVDMGQNFQHTAKDLLHDALIGGVSWAFWEVDSVKQFKSTEFIPILDDDNGNITKGIRMSQLAPDRPIIYEFFELDGMTSFRQNKQGGKIEQVSKIMPYRYSERRWGNERQITNAQNYNVLPIVPMYVNREKTSFLSQPVKSKIDAYDMMFTFYTDEFLKSNFIYFIMSGVGGTLEELVEVRNAAMQLGLIKIDGRDSTIDAKTLEPPHEAFDRIMDRLEDGVYQDSMTFNPAKIAGSANIATAIMAGQKPEEISSGGTEGHVRKCIEGILAIRGIESEVIITPTEIIDDKSKTEMVSMMVDRQVLTPEMAVSFVPWMRGREDEIIASQRRELLGLDEYKESDDL